MISSAWAWATSRGKIRTNEIHGEDEIQIVMSETFGVNSAEIEEHERSGNISVKDRLFNYFMIDRFETPLFIISVSAKTGTAPQ